MIGVLAGLVIGSLATVFLGALVLVAVDARRWGYTRRPRMTAALRGMRGTLNREVTRPVRATSGRHLEKAGRSA